MKKVTTVFVILILAGCAARQTPTGKVKGTPQEQALAYNASIAQANNTLAQAVINATSAASPLIDVATANKILAVQSRVADVDRQLTPLLGDTANLGKNGAQIRQFVDQIQAAANTLITSGDLGIKDQKTQQTVTVALKAIYTGADGIISVLTAAGLLGAS